MSVKFCAEVDAIFCDYLRAYVKNYIGIHRPDITDIDELELPPTSLYTLYDKCDMCDSPTSDGTKYCRVHIDQFLAMPDLDVKYYKCVPIRVVVDDKYIDALMNSDGLLFIIGKRKIKLIGRVTPDGHTVLSCNRI
jgi:hypothetical protein